MIKKIAVLVTLLYGLWIMDYGLVFAQEDVREAEKRAEEIHKVASSDVIYVDEELKALYYQNIQIIGLLKEIRNLLQQQLEKKE